MSKRLTIVLSDEEYGDLERRALADRRTVRQMAEKLVTQPQGNVLTIATRPYTWDQTYYPTITSGGITASPCPACTNPLTSAAHSCLRLQNYTVGVGRIDA